MAKLALLSLRTVARHEQLLMCMASWQFTLQPLAFEQSFVCGMTVDLQAFEIPHARFAALATAISETVGREYT